MVEPWTEGPRLLERLRATPPLVQCITNYVSMDIAANAVLAVGASPAMVHAREEAADFAALASALVLNIGTASGHWVDAMVDAARVARKRGRPVILDPVAAGATAFRREACRRLLEVGVDVIRANASEILALAADSGARGRGVDATDPVEDAWQAARELQQKTGAVVAVTGPVDRVFDEHRTAEIAGGHPLMAKVTAVGCAASAVVGSFCAVTDDYWGGTVAALSAFGTAGAAAGIDHPGPATFRTRLLDGLHALEPAELAGVQIL